MDPTEETGLFGPLVPKGLQSRAQGFNLISANLMRGPNGRMAFVPEGQCDRSLAQSARDIATPRNRPVGYGLIVAGMRTSIR